MSKEADSKKAANLNIDDGLEKIDRASLVDGVIEEINRRTRMTSRSPFLV